MMVITAKMKKRNIFLILAAIAAILLLLRPGRNAGTVANSEVAHKADTNEGRIAFLESFGWKVEESPKESQDVRIPSSENEVFARYNDLQKSQGFDLSRYAGKTAKRFVYKITNHPDGDEYYATVLVRDGTVIGGDVASNNPNGKMHGFSIPT